MHILPRRRLIICGHLIFFYFCNRLGASEAAGSGAAHHIFQWRPFLAPFHAVVLHFPIGFLTGAFILEIFRTIRPSEELRRATSLFLWLSLFSGILAATFGIMRADCGGYDGHAVAQHRMSGFLVLSFTLVTAVLAMIAGARRRSAWTQAYRVGLVATLALLVVAGHLGGNLTHGSKYLVENAPDFVRTFLDENRDSEPSAAALDKQEQFYVEKVQPIFSEKCFGCHGPEKKKGGLRLDVAESALKGGESGKPAVKPGDPMDSQMIRLMLLPPDHDDVMPPDGKTPLSPEEMGLVIQWIRDGASFPKSNLPSGGAD